MQLQNIFFSRLAVLALMFCASTPPAWATVYVSIQPSNQSTLVGSNAVLTAQVSADAGETITGFSWLMSTNGQEPFVLLPNQTGPTCTLTNVQTTDSGSYIVKVANRYGTSILPPITSAPASLAVHDPARIVGQPQGGLIQITGSSASFSVAALGESLTYQWRLNGTNLLSDGRIAGAQAATLSLSNLAVADSGSYDVVVTNLYNAATSQVATLSVFAPPSILLPPADTAVILGSNASFSVTADGSEPLSFRWRKNGVNLSDGGRLSGATNATLLITGITTGDAAGYSVVLSNIIGSVTSTVATLTVLVPPTITSSARATGKQGAAFSYTMTATGTTPLTLSADGLPDGLNFDPARGRISGAPIVSGTFPITLSAANQVSTATKLLTLTVASSVPVITNALTAAGQENQAGFSYTIRATDSPTQFGASGLPMGLSLDPATGVIAGTPLYGGSYNVLIWAANAWGVGSTNLALNIAYAPVTGLAITDVINTWSTPYLLDFAFSLRDNADPTVSNPVIRSPSDLQVVCLEGGQPIPSETAFVLEKASKKQMRSILALDYTYSMFAVPGAIDAMQAATKLLINEEPPTALFGLYEFHADYVTPQWVTTNGFTSDKAALGRTIDAIQDTYVQDNYAGTRCWDAMYAALGQFGPTNRDEARFLVAMTDGNDDSSLLNTNKDPVAALVKLARANQVRIFCVAFGPGINTNALAQLTSQTYGHYYVAGTTADLTVDFQNILKDIDSQYELRWATMQRTPTAFQPSFQVTVDGLTASFNTDPIYVTNTVIETNIVDDVPTVVTNTTVTNKLSLPYTPTAWAGNIKAGSLRLVADSDIGPQTIRLRATYVPRYIRQLHLHYQANYPCTTSLASSATNELLYGWSLVETNDGAGGKWLTLASPDPTNLLTSLPYGAMGDLVTFHFQYPESVTTTQAFSLLAVDNSIYTNMPPSGQTLAFENAASFITTYPAAPPHGTPIPWLLAWGFTTNFAAAELSDPNGNGLPVWQEYLAGLNPRDPNATFAARFTGPPAAPQVTFDTVVTRTYRVEAATALDNWTTLLDNIAGTGGPITVTDQRNLSGVHQVFYRVVVY